LPAELVPLKSPEEVFLEHLELIERTASRACRRRRLGPAETEDFVSQVKVKLIEDDYAVLRKFRGKSRVSTYLITVINNYSLDYLDHLYGKWRPSAEARRQGPVAVILDRLLTRDGYSFDEACQILTTNLGVECDWRELDQIAARLPPRSPRQSEGEESLRHLPAPDGRPDRRFFAKELDSEKRRILILLHEALETLPAADRLIVKLRCRLTVAEIARRLHREQKPLYRRIDGILGQLRRDLEAKGVTAAEVAELLAADDAGEEPSGSGPHALDRRPGAESGRSRPSNDK
jgi:RNA polymerase sigma factor (sigma-70 family)